jgi:hypothetical protein
MEIFKTFDERCGTPEHGDQCRLIMGNKAVGIRCQSHLSIKLVRVSYNEYSQIELSNVSAASFCNEQTLLGLLSILLHLSGSWNPKVRFKYRGWKKPLKTMVDALMEDI